MNAAKSKPEKRGLLWLDELSTVEAGAAVKEGTVIIFPIGTVEEHGDHLPLCTDSIQPEYIALEVAKRTGCLVAPPFRHGVCNAGRNFPGTLSIGFDTLRLVVRDVLAELVRNGFRRVIVLTGHSGSSHMTALNLAAQEIVRKNADANEKARVMVVADFDLGVELLKDLWLPESDGHAAALETSRVMDIRPDLIKGKGKAGKMNTPRFEVVADPERYFIGGVNGDPTLASVEKGKAVNAYIIEQVVKLVDELRT
jgi:creatinine amidohydrolase